MPLDLEAFRYDATCSGSSLNDKALLNGFLQMPALKKLQVSVDKQVKLRFCGFF